jgi:internalin A
MTKDELAVANFIQFEKEVKSGELVFFGQKVKSLPKEIGDLSWLTYFKFNESPVDNLGGVRYLKNLKQIHFDSTNISDLTPLAKLSNLSEISCSNTKVNDLGPLSSLQNLEILYCSYCDVVNDAPFLCDLPRLQLLVFKPGPKGGLGTVPRELLGNDNCFERVRSYYRSLKGGTVPINAAKLFIYGNGEIGKTQLARQLDPPSDGPAYDPTIKTTHGVQVRQFTLPGAGLSVDGAKPLPLTLKLWNFGGQDLYHGTHALFLRDRAIHLIAWTPESESGQRRDEYGYLSTNQPLSYWLSFARAIGERSALIVAQTQADRPEDARLWTEAKMASLASGFGNFYRFVPTSSKTGIGISELKNAIEEAGKWTHVNFGRVRISVGWAAVAAELERLHAEDAVRASDARRHRMLTDAQFKQICHERGVTRDFDTLLYYLNAVGTIFWSGDLFSGLIILDQSWALDAIYAIFDRASCLRQLRAARGRFTARDLAE